MDTRTLAVVILGTSFILSFMSFLIERFNNPKGVLRPGLFSANFLIFLGFLLLLTQGILSPWLSVVLANVFILLGFANFSYTFLNFWGRRMPWIWVLAGLGAVVVLLIYFGVFYPETGPRILGVSLALALFLVLVPGSPAPKAAPKALRQIYLGVQVLFAIGALFFLIRIWFTWFNPPATVFTFDGITAYLFLITTLLAIAWTVGYILLTGIRTNLNLEARTVELKDAVDQRDRIFSIIGHDLQTPMGSLRELLDIITPETCLDEDTLKELVVALKRGTQEMNHLLDSLVQWGLAQKGRELQGESLELRPLIQGIFKNHEKPLGEKSIDWEIQIPEGLRIFTEEASFLTIFRNLLGNAVKFTPPGGRIRFSAQEESGHWLLTLENTGRSIPQNRMETLFQVVPGRSTPGTQGERGSGLGLLICHELAKRLTAALEAENLPEGVRFTLKLPQKPGL